MKWILNPAAFNWLIMALYFLAACRWTIAGRYVDSAYWLSALAITTVVTFGYRH